MDGAAVGARASEDGRPLRGRRSGRPAPAASCSSCATASTTVSGPGRSSIAARGTPSRHRAIALGRRSDAYIGCVPCTRRHGDRDAVDHSFVLWADCDGEGRALGSLS
jgi:hypothetical protein